MSLLSTSGIIVILCILVGLYLVMNRRSKASAHVPLSAEMYAEDVLEDAVAQAIEQQQSGSFSSAFSQSPGHTQPVSPRYRLKYGRIAIFALGALALLAALVTAVAAAFTPLSWALPLLFVFITLVSLVTLRLLAIQDRNKHRARSALAVEQNRRHTASLAAASTSAQEAEAENLTLDHKAPPAPRQRQQLPVNHAVKALRQARTHHVSQRPAIEPQLLTGAAGSVRTEIEAKLPATTWQPTAVPRPTYLDAPLAHTELPEPVEHDTATQSHSQAPAQAAALNLDDVLARRRAS